MEAATVSEVMHELTGMRVTVTGTYLPTFCATVNGIEPVGNNVIVKTSIVNLSMDAGDITKIETYKPGDADIYFGARRVSFLRCK